MEMEMEIEMDCIDFSHIKINQNEISIYRKIISQLLEENKKLKEENEKKLLYSNDTMYRF